MNESSATPKASGREIQYTVNEDAQRRPEITDLNETLQADSRHPSAKGPKGEWIAVACPSDV